MAYKVDSADSAVTEPARPAAGSLKFFSDALRTTVSGWWLNMVQNEICGAVTKFGLTLDKSADNQLGLAIEAAVTQGLATIKTDLEYKAITSTTSLTPLFLSTSGGAGWVDVIFTISDFVGTGLVHGEIREIYIESTLGSAQNQMITRATWPDGTTHDLCAISATGTADGSSCNNTIAVPIDAITTTITMSIQAASGATGTVAVVGARQRLN